LNFLLEYWFDEELRAIKDTLGTFIVVDSSFKSLANRVVAHILVELDSSKGLFESIKLVEREHTYA